MSARPPLGSVDARGLAVLGYLGLYLAIAALLSTALGLKPLLPVEWPTDLYGLSLVTRPTPLDVGIVGSSRAHYAFLPRALDACLGAALGRPTRSEAANRVTASAFAVAALARDHFSGDKAPPTLVIEVAPDALNRNHFELRHNVATTAEWRDLPACLAEVPATRLRVGDCLSPLARPVSNLAHLLHRPFAELDHIRWMALVEGGGQYCATHPSCEARNADYDARHAGRWATREAAILPRVRSERFADYQIEGGLGALAFTDLLASRRAAGLATLVINLPVSEAYQREIPPADYEQFQAWIHATTEAQGARYLDWNRGDWTDRQLYLDPDHLNARGAHKATAALCRALTDALH